MGLPSAIEGSISAIEVTANELLVAVVWNLVNNAVQQNDEADPVVTVAETTINGLIEVSVTDTGPGTPDDRQVDVFGKGDKGLDSPGTGIGLCLANVLVFPFGGTVPIGDNAPGGTIVRIQLPVPRADAKPSTG